MGANDAKEMLEVAKAEVVRLEAERDEWKRLFTECHPAHLDAVTKLEQVRRLHEVATDRTAAVRVALDRADARFAAREHGGVILGDFQAEVKAALADTGAALREHDEQVIRTYAQTIATAHREATVEALVQSHAKANEDVADALDQPGKLWHGDGGVSVLVDEATLTRVPLVDWLRARASAIRGEADRG